jgi:hypothetical protein
MQDVEKSNDAQITAANIPSSYSYTNTSYSNIAIYEYDYNGWYKINLSNLILLVLPVSSFAEVSFTG